MCLNCLIMYLILFQVIYYKVGKWYESHNQEGFFPVEGDGRSRKRFKNVLSTARSMILVILLCWAPGRHTLTHLKLMWYTLSTANPCQIDFCCFLPVAVLFLILLSNLWPKIEQHILFGIYIIQVHLRRTRPNLKK